MGAIPREERPYRHLQRHRGAAPGVRHRRRRTIQSRREDPGLGAVKIEICRPKSTCAIVLSFRALCGTQDVWNEPDNTNGNSYHDKEPRNKEGRVTELLPKARVVRAPVCGATAKRIKAGVLLRVCCCGCAEGFWPMLLHDRFSSGHGMRTLLSLSPLASGCLI